MIPKSQASNHLALEQASETSPLWVTELRQAIRDPLVICKELDIDPAAWPGLAEGFQLGHQLFKTLVPRPFLQRMQKGKLNDPLLLQVLPSQEEDLDFPGFVSDPLQEAKFNPLPGLIHKYKSRVLLTLSGACAINCRYCFRRHFPYAENSLSKKALANILEYLKAHPSINEIILSGGDPLATPDRRLQEIIQQLEGLPQIKRLRIHTRLPVVLPSRVDQQLLHWIEATRFQVVMVVHINHPQELDEQLESALRKLSAAGVTLLNQSVLLKQVNDHAEVLTLLSEKLFAAGVLPYYLHAFDPIKGAAHFATDDQQAKTIHAELLANLPGYLVPRLVREYSDQPSKTPLS